LIHSLEMPLRWGDMDAYGHLNNTLYFRFCEEARVQALQAMGASLVGSGQEPVIINASCTFLRQVVYPDTLRVETHAGPAGRSSFMLFYQMYSEQQGELVCEGSSKVVWMDHATAKSTPLPEHIRQQLPSAQ